MKFNYFSRQKLRNDRIKVTLPNKNDVTYDSLYGMENATEILRDIVNYFDPSKPSIEPNMSYAIVGPMGCGKASIVYATAKAANIPVIDVDTSIFFGLIDEEDIRKKVDLIFSTGRKLEKEYKGCAIIFRNVNVLEGKVEISTRFYNDICRNYEDSENIFLFATCTIPTFFVPPSIEQNELFFTTIEVIRPTPEVREKIIKAYIKNNNIEFEETVSIEELVEQTFLMNPHDIVHIIKNAKLYSVRKGHEKITQSDFSEIITAFKAGDKTHKMTQKERISTAYHEAGHVVAGYFCNPEFVATRVEISPRTQSLGLTIDKIAEKKYTYFRSDFEKEIIVLFGGLCAEEIVYGEHSSGVSSDLIYVTANVIDVIGAYGMDKEFGYTVTLGGVNDSPYREERIEKFSDKITKDMYKKTMKILSDKRPYLEALTKALIKKERLLTNEIEEIFKNVAKELGDDDIFSNRSKEE